MLENSLLIGLSGLELTDKESRQLTHPYVAGVILFARNYCSPAQLTALTAWIRSINPHLLIAVDQEGGRVQRFKEGFTLLPAAHEIGLCYDQSPAEGLAYAEAMGFLMATELKTCGVTLSFAPVADLYMAEGKIIGSRAFHQDPYVVAQLTIAYYQGMKKAGVMAVAKHFPGHGSIPGDTHVEQVVDDRPFAEISQKDLVPFKQLVKAGIPGVMAAHVIYPQVDALPVGYSKHWLQTVLRQQLGFEGLVFSDDMGMQAAKTNDTPDVLIKKAKAAGCDRILLCNEFSVIDDVLTA